MFEPMTEQLRMEYVNAKQTFGVLQQLCEGHNLVTQDVLRSQPMHAKDVNLVSKTMDMLSLQAGSDYEMTQMETVELELMISSLDFLIELVQGPCKGNQDLMAKDSAFLHSLATSNS
jgi:hypothetical protein